MPNIERISSVISDVVHGVVHELVMDPGLTTGLVCWRSFPKRHTKKALRVSYKLRMWC